MKLTSEHCDLCGRNMKTSRENGWAGTMFIKGQGNFHVYGINENLVTCSGCGKKIVDFIKSIKKEFKLTVVKEN